MSTPGRGVAAPAAGHERSPAIDGLRTVAVALVVVFHMFPQRLVGGAVGVDVFFVISGLVITTTLLQERAATGRIRLRAFYARRWWRLMPALALVGGTVLVLSLLTPRGLFVGQGPGALAAVSYTMNLARSYDWAAPGSLDVMGHAWSLGMEEQFYLLWPLLLIALSLRPRIAWPLFAAILLLPTVLRVRQWAPSEAFQIYNTPWTRYDELLIGAALALLLNRVPAAAVLRFARPLLWPAVAALALIAVGLPMGRADHWTSRWYYTGGFLAISLLSAVVLACLTLDRTSVAARLLAWRPVSTFGRRYSYGMYLWHYVVLYLATALFPGDRLVWLSVQVVALSVLVPLTHAWVERPALQLAARLSSSSTAAAGIERPRHAEARRPTVREPATVVIRRAERPLPQVPVPVVQRVPTEARS
ncbi:acyltransferase family protein [Modestobacter versicolor]|uniref:Acyltransferase n=1 Tax=Modestobacter versicolor TaxID=429133 RepID=A0A323VFV8_9ACTN|nr:acyltransferase [Modestobacter versicolor]MBB3677005.1 peptidoglycan/LPS O-acetylase OafA/YrhL [Modestobacter versicolor]PZA22950.1 acyltransferase [Modestobacter versicolor]